MIKTITKVGNSHAIIIDRTLMDLANLRPGAEVNVTVREEGTIIIEPIRKTVDPEIARSVAHRLVRSNDELFRRLSR